MAVHVWPPSPPVTLTPQIPWKALRCTQLVQPTVQGHPCRSHGQLWEETAVSKGLFRAPLQGPISLRDRGPRHPAVACESTETRSNAPALTSAPGCPELTALPRGSAPWSPLCRWESVAFPRHSSSISSVWGRTTPPPAAKQTSQWRTSSFYIIFTTLFKHHINRQRLMVEICIVSWLTDLSLPTQLDPSPPKVRSTTELRLGPPARTGWGCGGEKVFPGPAQLPSHSSQEVAWGELDGAGNTT